MAWQLTDEQKREIELKEQQRRAVILGQPLGPPASAPPAPPVSPPPAEPKLRDSLGLWLVECCEVGGTFSWEGCTKLWTNWKQWAEAAGEDPGSQKLFSRALKARGFSPKRQSGVGRSGFRGLKLKHGGRP
jgi:putative DNA primase/helicase